MNIIAGLKRLARPIAPIVTVPEEAARQRVQRTATDRGLCSDAARLVAAFWSYDIGLVLLRQRVEAARSVRRPYVAELDLAWAFLLRVMPRNTGLSTPSCLTSAHAALL